MDKPEKSDLEKKSAEKLVESILEQKEQDLALSTSLAISAAIALVSEEFIEILQSRLQNMSFRVTKEQRHTDLESYTLTSELGEVVIEIDIGNGGILDPTVYLGGNKKHPNLSLISGSINNNDRITLDLDNNEEEEQTERFKQIILDWIQQKIEAIGTSKIGTATTLSLD